MKATYILPSDAEVELEDPAKIRALKVLKKAMRLRDEIGTVATWCDASEVGRYDLSTLINNLAAEIAPTIPTVKYLR